MLNIVRRRLSAALALISAAVLAGCGDCGNCTVPAYNPTPAPAVCLQTAARGQALPNLGAAAPFAILAGSAVNNAGASIVTGELGVSPGKTVTGFPPGTVSGAMHADDAAAQQAQSDLSTAYGDLVGRTGGTPVTGDLGGLTLFPGLYTSVSSLAIASGNLTLDAQGDPSGVFIFQVASTLSVAPDRAIELIGSAHPCHVFWQVGNSANLGAASTFQGSILANQAITIGAGAAMHGRALARSGAVTLDTDTVTDPAP